MKDKERGVVYMTNITREIPKGTIEYLKRVFNLLGQGYSVSEDGTSIVTALSDEDWEHSVKDALAFSEKDEKGCPFNIVTAYTADNPERLAKLGISEEEPFVIYSKDQENILL